MIKKSILLLTAIACIAGNAKAQKCATDEVYRDAVKLHPEIEQFQQALNDAWRGVNSNDKTTASPNFQAYQDSVYEAVIGQKMIVPVVVHIIHDYGTEYVSDNIIFQMIKEMNEIYNKKNSDLSQVIAPFVPYVGNANIEFRLAQKDPVGNPTIGITRRRSYLTAGGDDQAKFDEWAPDRYLNIWVIRKIGRSPSSGTILAYATPPSSGAAQPYYDGVMAAAPYLVGGDKTISHEVGHVFNLQHPWNSSGKEVGQACGDDDVDDTPPTKGHFSTCPLNDSVCANGYEIEYSYYNTVSHSVEKFKKNYPDTTNVQNIMDYSNCTVMFTKQQVMRMRAALRNSVANRNVLVSSLAHTASGIGDTLTPFFRRDMAAQADFSVEKGAGLSPDLTYFGCADNSHLFNFRDRSWRDTVTSVSWQFGNGGTTTSTPAPGGQVSVKFTEPGWADVTLTATSNAGSTSVTKKIYAASPEAKNPNGYYQEFTDAAENEKWPVFNYYENYSKWRVVNNAGYYDKTSIMYNAYDDRAGLDIFVGAPAVLATSFKSGDYDDFFTPAFDLSNMGAECTLSFLTAGIWRVTQSAYMKDTFEVAYSTDCGSNWSTIKRMSNAELAAGSYSGQYIPLDMSEWVLRSISVPVDGRKSKTFFRFRYKPSADNSNILYQGVGNNFYIDRINVNPYPVGINTLVGNGQNIAVAPNPTTSSAYVVVRNTTNTVSDVNVTVTDITGKVVYRTSESLSGTIGRIEIPAETITVKGVYMVHVLCGTETKTQKLVVR